MVYINGAKYAGAMLFLFRRKDRPYLSFPNKKIFLSSYYSRMPGYRIPGYRIPFRGSIGGVLLVFFLGLSGRCFLELLGGSREARFGLLL